MEAKSRKGNPIRRLLQKSSPEDKEQSRSSPRDYRARCDYDRHDGQKINSLLGWRTWCCQGKRKCKSSLGTLIKGCLLWREEMD